MDEPGGARGGPGYLGTDGGMQSDERGEAITGAQLKAHRVGVVSGGRLVKIDVGDDRRGSLPGQREARPDGDVIAQEALVVAPGIRAGLERGVQVQEEGQQARGEALGRVPFQLEIDRAGPDASGHSHPELRRDLRDIERLLVETDSPRNRQVARGRVSRLRAGPTKEPSRG